MFSLGKNAPLFWTMENFSYILTGKIFLYPEQKKISLLFSLGKFSSIQDRGKCFPKEIIEKIFLYLGWRKNFSRGKHQENFPLSRIERNVFPRKTQGEFSSIQDRAEENFFPKKENIPLSRIEENLFPRKAQGNFPLFSDLQNTKP